MQPSQTRATTGLVLQLEKRNLQKTRANMVIYQVYQSINAWLVMHSKKLVVIEFYEVQRGEDKHS